MSHISRPLSPIHYIMYVCRWICLLSLPLFGMFIVVVEDSLRVVGKNEMCAAMKFTFPRCDIRGWAKGKKKATKKNPYMVWWWHWINNISSCCLRFGGTEVDGSGQRVGQNKKREKLISESRNNNIESDKINQFFRHCRHVYLFSPQIFLVQIHFCAGAHSLLGNCCSLWVWVENVKNSVWYFMKRLFKQHRCSPSSHSPHHTQHTANDNSHQAHINFSTLHWTNHQHISMLLIILWNTFSSRLTHTESGKTFYISTNFSTVIESTQHMHCVCSRLSSSAPLNDNNLDDSKI